MDNCLGRCGAGCRFYAWSARFVGPCSGFTTNRYRISAVVNNLERRTACARPLHPIRLERVACLGCRGRDVCCRGRLGDALWLIVPAPPSHLSHTSSAVRGYPETNV